jgi:hypothetical protein
MQCPQGETISRIIFSVKEKNGHSVCRITECIRRKYLHNGGNNRQEWNVSIVCIQIIQNWKQCNYTDIISPKETEKDGCLVCYHTSKNNWCFFCVWFIPCFEKHQFILYVKYKKLISYTYRVKQCLSKTGEEMENKNRESLQMGTKGY